MSTTDRERSPRTTAELPPPGAGDRVQESDDEEYDGEDFTTSAPGARRRSKIVHCQAEGCWVELDAANPYCRKRKLCQEHMKANSVRRRGYGDELWRFCQQCGKLEPLECFDGAKRSCRAQLARRREANSATASRKRDIGAPSEARAMLRTSSGRGGSNADARSQRASSPGGSGLDDVQPPPPPQQQQQQRLEWQQKQEQWQQQQWQQQQWQQQQWQQQQQQQVQLQWQLQWQQQEQQVLQQQGRGGDAGRNNLLLQALQQLQQVCAHQEHLQLVCAHQQQELQRLQAQQHAALQHMQEPNAAAAAASSAPELPESLIASLLGIPAADARALAAAVSTHSPPLAWLLAQVGQLPATGSAGAAAAEAPEPEPAPAPAPALAVAQSTVLAAGSSMPVLQGSSQPATLHLQGQQQPWQMAPPADTLAVDDAPHGVVPEVIPFFAPAAPRAGTRHPPGRSAAAAADPGAMGRGTGPAAAQAWGSGATSLVVVGQGHEADLAPDSFVGLLDDVMPSVPDITMEVSTGALSGVLRAAMDLARADRAAEERAAGASAPEQLPAQQGAMAPAWGAAPAAGQPPAGAPPQAHDAAGSAGGMGAATAAPELQAPAATPSGTAISAARQLTQMLAAMPPTARAASLQMCTSFLDQLPGLDSGANLQSMVGLSGAGAAFDSFDTLAHELGSALEDAGAQARQGQVPAAAAAAPSALPPPAAWAGWGRHGGVFDDNGNWVVHWE